MRFALYIEYVAVSITSREYTSRVYGSTGTPDPQLSDPAESKHFLVE